MAELRGSYTVTFTPFTEGGAAIDFAALERFIDWQIEEGSHGLIALGSIGQFLAIDDDERTAIVETYVKKCKGRVPVLVGTMNARTENAVRYSREAEALGAAGVMITPPYYYTPTEDEIFDYYRQISEAISIPIMLYNNPITTNVDMSAAFVAKLTKAFENVRYIKEASGTADRCYEIAQLTDGVMNCFAGGRTYECMLFGAAGYVSPPGNWAPKQSAIMMDSFAAGDRATAKWISDKFTAFSKVLGAGHPAYGHSCYSRELIKWSGHDLGDPRAPISPFSALGKEGTDRMAQVRPLYDEIRAFDLAKKVAAQ